MVELWGRESSRPERDVRLLRFATCARFDFEVLIDRGFDIGRPQAWWSQAGLVGPWCCEPDGIGWFRGYLQAAVLNQAAALGVYQGYRREQLPRRITCWWQLGLGTYVVAMEPSNNRVAGQVDARERRELMYLAPDEQGQYDLETGALTGSEMLKEFAANASELAAASLAGALE